MTTYLDLVVYGLALYGTKCLMVRFKLWDPFMILLVSLIRGVKKEMEKANKNE